MIVYVTPEAADYIVLEDFGFYYRDRGLMLSALGAPMPVFGHEAYPGIHQKAAAYITAINRNHPVMEGNKRTSWAVTAFFYAENGYTLTAAVDDAFEFVKALANHRLEFEEVVAWLEAHARPQD